jgi:hypothetical protein
MNGAIKISSMIREINPGALGIKSGSGRNSEIRSPEATPEVNKKWVK